MSWEENSFHAKVNPRRRKVGKRDTPILFPLVDVGFIHEPVYTSAKAKEAFMILPLMFKRDLRIDLEKGRQERSRRIRVPSRNGRRRYESSHLVQGNRSGGAIVEENGILGKRPVA
jgi:hypothetical protein